MPLLLEEFILGKECCLKYLSQLFFRIDCFEESFVLLCLSCLNRETTIMAFDAHT